MPDLMSRLTWAAAEDTISASSWQVSCLSCWRLNSSSSLAFDSSFSMLAIFASMPNKYFISRFAARQQSEWNWTKLALYTCEINLNEMNSIVSSLAFTVHATKQTKICNKWLPPKLSPQIKWQLKTEKNGAKMSVTVLENDDTNCLLFQKKSSLTNW